MRNSQANAILDNITDPKQRALIERILYKKIVKQVLCGSKECQGRIVASIDQNNKIEPTLDNKGSMWLLAYRQRLDGYWGFQCLCGNDSRLCRQEIGVKGIEENAVTKDDLDQVWINLEKKPANYPVNNGKQNIDNFIIQEI
jgi:hypothetical protein